LAYRLLDVVIICLTHKNPDTSSFFGSLKKERIKKRINKTRELAHADVFDYVEVLSNRQRRHSHLGGSSPEAFEQASL
jgi:putative transposase